MEKYQTLLRRFGAGIIDSLILAPISWFIAFVVFLVGSTTAARAVSPALVGLISVSYYILMHNFYGQTVGKMAARVKVLDDSEIRVNFGQAVLRSLPQLIPAMFAVSFSTADHSTEDVTLLLYGSLSLFYLVDIIVCLSNEKHRALHDFMAGTVVIRTDV
jgi:uncharacterized RDD family membrane protein YckC